MKLFIALCVLWLLPFIITAYFNQPAIDDFWNANAVATQGKWGAVTLFYHTVSARYSASFIMSFCNTLPSGKVWLFKVWPVVVILFLLGAFYYFYRCVFSENGSALYLISFSFLFVVMHLANMRSMFEGLYWMSSTVCYQLAIGFFVIGIGAIIKDIKKPALFTKFVAIASCLILPGTVEIIIPIYILTLLVILYFSYRVPYAKKLVVSCLTIAFIVLLFVVASQGNLARVKNDSLSYHPHLLEALFYSARAVGYYTLLWLFNPLMISAFMLFLLSQNRFIKTTHFALQKRDIFIICTSFFLMFIAVYLPLNLFESATPFPRITTLFFCLFFHFCLMISHQFISLSYKRIHFINCWLRIKYIQPILFAAFFICAFTNKNFVQISRDLLNGKAMKYNKETEARYKLIRSCTTDTCYVPAHKNWPYFVQSSATENKNPDAFQHEDVYFKKIILLR